LDPEGQVSDERMLEVLEKAKMSELLLLGSAALNMEITENGANLSSGEKQLICICKAILRVRH
jgi:ABC-type multidrug transport system fused ATPase/permease subunit